MSKRKRDPQEEAPASAKLIKLGDTKSSIHIQIITGSYERTLHGITAAIPRKILDLKNIPEEDTLSVSFADSFLFNAHTSAIRCLALAPLPAPTASAQKVVLATGSTDERINLFHLSTRPPKGPVLPSLKAALTIQDPGNRSLGVLHTHDATITALYFPSKSKLISSCSNNVIAITSTRNWSTLSLIKAPTPKHPNRPTGDTSTASTLPAGINDFAVHPSMKIMISVGRAERNLRLWNLITGKKAGVLSFGKEMLKELGESSSRWGSGEGRKVLWNNSGEEFAVAFEWGACIFGEDCQPKAKIVTTPRTKIHQAHYIPDTETDILSISTEDGRILFYSVDNLELTPKPKADPQKPKSNGESSSLPACKLIGQLGGSAVGHSNRIKDYLILTTSQNDPEKASTSPTLLIVTAGSDGSVRVWALEQEELSLEQLPKSKKPAEVQQVGRLLGSYETGNRITCLQAFVMTGDPEEKDAGDEMEEVEDDALESSESEDDN